MFCTLQKQKSRKGFQRFFFYSSLCLYKWPINRCKKNIIGKSVTIILLYNLSGSVSERFFLMAMLRQYALRVVECRL